MHRQSVKLKSGESSDCYYDIKKVFGYPDTLNLIADELARFLSDGVTCVAGSGFGGLPIAAVIASKQSKKFIAIREKTKSYGMGGNIEGYMPTKDDQIVVVDDVFDSGSSLRKTLAVLEKTGATVVSAVVVLKIGSTESPIPVNHIFTIEDLEQD